MDDETWDKLLDGEIDPLLSLVNTTELLAVASSLNHEGFGAHSWDSFSYSTSRFNSGVGVGLANVV